MEHVIGDRATGMDTARGRTKLAKSNLRFRSPLAFALLVVGMLAIIMGGQASASTAPDFQATVLETGADVSLADLRGDFVLLNTWATWCTPCKEEMPWLETLHERYAA